MQLQASDGFIEGFHLRNRHRLVFAMPPVYNDRENSD